MASFQKYKKRDGSIVWRTQLFVNGIRQSQTFDTKAEAKRWAAATEVQITINTGKDLNPNAASRTVEDVFERYAKEVSPTKRGKRWEQIRLISLGRTTLAKVPLSQLGPDHLAAWRDQRLKQVSSSTVRREMALISHALDIARREWLWLNQNHAKDVRKPPSPPHRTQRISDEDLQKLLDALTYVAGTTPTNKSQEVAVALLLCLETACRSGEILSLTRANVHLGQSYIHLPLTKNGSSRDVPLSNKAKQLIQLLLDRPAANGDLLFSIKPTVRDVLFRRAKTKAGLENINFHDSRRTATTRLATTFSPLELAKITGHKDLKMLLVYYSSSASELAEKLNRSPDH